MNTELHSTIIKLLPSLHGWCEVDKALTLVNLVLASKARRIVEIGTWGGRSAIPMALACRQNGDGVVICIDPWNPNASADGQTTEVDRKWWGTDVNHELVYQHFRYTIKEFHMEQWFEIHRVKSADVDPPPNIEILHVDGNHGPDAYLDTTRYGVNVVIGGFCILDDLGWFGGHVQRAADWLLDNGFMHLHPLGSGAIYLRTK
jgi:hypothetical protein